MLYTKTMLYVNYNLIFKNRRKWKREKKKNQTTKVCPCLDFCLEFHLFIEIKVIQAIETLTLLHRFCHLIKVLENQKS